MRTDLRTHPKVVRMASALKSDRLRVVGGLWAVWAIFDTHSVDGVLDGYTLQTIDEDLGWRGFGKAMAAIDWLIEAEAGLQVPDFEEHNGASAKRRAQDTRRKQSDRAEDHEAHGSWNSVRNSSVSDIGQVSSCDADKAGTRKKLDKRRNAPPSPKGEPDGFADFWEAYPKKVARKDALKAFAKVAPGPDLLAELLAAVRRQAQSADWLKDGGQYVPNAATWLNGSRWEDEGRRATARSDIFAGAL